MAVNLRIPAEWEQQQAIQLTWPHADSDWQPWIDRIESVFINLVTAISQYQAVMVACHPSCFERVKNDLAEIKAVTLYPIASNDTWARDHGPISQYQQGQLRLLNFIFNGWGSKYGANLDNQITEQLSQQNAFAATELVSCDWILEGGSIESDGQGTCLTTSRCLLNPNRNSQLSQADLEQHLASIGFDRTLWLTEGYLAGDDTDAHIDTLARFCSTDTIAYVQCLDSEDIHYQPLLAMEQQLQQFKTRKKQNYRLVPLPLPSPCYNRDGDRLPATYANFLMINGAVLVPTYNVKEDKIALEIIQNLFPTRDIIGIDCRTVIEQFGSLHCLTMQIHTSKDPASDTAKGINETA